MQIRITSRHMELTPYLKEYVESRVSKLAKFANKPIEAHMVLSVEKYRHTAELTLSADRNTMHGTETSNDIYLSIDRVMDKMERQVQKNLSKLRGDKNRKKEPLPRVVQEEMEEEGTIKGQGIAEG